MADLPIPFSAPMICALLDGRKTMTRRLLTRLRGEGEISEFGLSTTRGYDWHFRDSGASWHDVRNDRLLELLPWRAKGRLWVKEAWRAAPQFDDRKPSEITPGNYLHYEADRHRSDLGRYRHARFMPRWASRLTLIVNSVKVERLQEISLQDVRSEGCEVREFWLFGANAEERQMIGANVFRELWGSLHGTDAWAANSYVAAISFRVVRANIDAPGAAGCPLSCEGANP